MDARTEGRSLRDRLSFSLTNGRQNIDFYCYSFYKLIRERRGRTERGRETQHECTIQPVPRPVNVSEKFDDSFRLRPPKVRSSVAHRPSWSPDEMKFLLEDK